MAAVVKVKKRSKFDDEVDGAEDEDDGADLEEEDDEVEDLFDDIQDSEIDGFILSDEEVKKKSAIWTEMNKDYLEQKDESPLGVSPRQKGSKRVRQVPTGFEPKKWGPIRKERLTARERARPSRGTLSDRPNCVSAHQRHSIHIHDGFFFLLPTQTRQVGGGARGGVRRRRRNQAKARPQEEEEEEPSRPHRVLHNTLNTQLPASHFLLRLKHPF